MRQTTGTRKSPGEKIVKDIKRATRKQYSSEEKIRIVFDGLRGEDSIAELCHTLCKCSCAKSATLVRKTPKLATHWARLAQPRNRNQRLSNQRHRMKSADNLFDKHRPYDPTRRLLSLGKRKTSDGPPDKASCSPG
jgi:hypothetical protein